MRITVILNITIIFFLVLFWNHSGLATTHEETESRTEFQDQSVTANNDFISMYENNNWTISVLNNDYGLNNGVGELFISSEPEHGTAKVTSQNKIIYTPDENFTGRDKFKYRICNTYGNCDEAWVDVQVKDYDFVPVANNDNVIYHSDSTTIFNVLMNDQYLYDLPLDVSIIQDLNFGHSTITEDLNIQITVTSYFLQKDSLIYQVCDEQGDCDQAFMYVTPHKDDQSPLIIPEGFSPNGDGFNDTFRVPRFDQYETLSLEVFNINGITVFESGEYKNDWDGKSNTGVMKGQLVSKGVYYYLLRIDEAREEFSGSLYISH